MADMAELGISVRADGVDDASRRLDDLTGAAARAEKAVQDLSSTKASSSVALAAAKAQYAKADADLAVARVSGDTSQSEIEATQALRAKTYAAYAAARADYEGRTAALAAAEAMREQAQAALAAARAASQNGRSFEAMSGTASSIADQFKDIAISLQGGESWMVVALQQGSQLAATLETIEGGAKGIAGAIGAALGSIFSPLSLLTVGAVAAAGALYQLFVNTNDSSEKSAQTLKEFDALVERIGKTSATSAEQIKKMLGEPQTRAALRADILETDLKLTSDLEAKFTEIYKSFDEFRLPAEGARARFMAMHDAAAQTKQKLAELGDELATGKKSAQEVYEELSKMETAGVVPPSLFTLVVGLRTGVHDAIELQKRLNALGDHFDNVSGDSIKGGRNALRNKADALEASTPLFFRMGMDGDLAEQLRSRTKAIHDVALGYQEATTAADKHADALKNVMQSLDDERMKLSMSATAQRELDEVRKAGVSATTAEGQAIIEKVRAIEAENAAQKSLSEQIDFAKSATTDFVSTFRQGMLSGQSAAKSFRDAFLNLADTILSKIEQMAVDKLFSSLFAPFMANTTLGAFIGAPAAVSSSNVRASAPRATPVPRSVTAQGQGVHITVGLKKNGLNIEPEVVDIARTEARSAAGAVQGTFNRWRDNGFHKDVENHLKSRRVTGRSS
jgi:hypothetical protein